MTDFSMKLHDVWTSLFYVRIRSVSFAVFFKKIANN